MTHKRATLPGHTPSTEALDPSLDLQEQIRRRAYELYERRGRDGGNELQDWLQAEAEVTRQAAASKGGNRKAAA